MKRLLKITSIAFVLMSSVMLQNKVSAQGSVSISFQTFYDDLSPYGRWIDYPDYGYVWCPDAGPGFRPYSTMGHWEWSDEYEWIWVSDYDWGWAPFHYGRWLYDPFYGWLWVPGYDWAPAWVVWRGGGDYYGWAPLRPGFNIGINFSIGLYSPPIDYWCFAPRQYITSPRIYDYCLSSQRNVNIINSTTIINNYNFYGGRKRNVFVNGPQRNEVEQYTHQNLRSVTLSESSHPGRSEFRNNQITMYRPNVQRDDNSRFSPRRFDRYNQSPQNNNGSRRDEVVSNRGNNLPERREQNNNANNNGWQNRNNRNVFERNNNPSNRDDQRRFNPFERRDQQSNGNRNFERNNNPSNRDDQRRFNPFERRDQQSNGNRNFERNNNRPNRDDQRKFNPFERRDLPQSNNTNNNGNRGFERRQQEQPRQFERQQSQQQQSQKQQPRILDRRDEGNQGSRSNDNNGKGNGRRKG